MKPQEAIKTLTKAKSTRSQRAGLDFIKAMDLAISSFEKQIPKKPIKQNPICYEKTIDGQEYYEFDYFCPNCNEQIKLTEHHCKCGQALDWSDSGE